jgi:hypothetical protein
MEKHKVKIWFGLGSYLLASASPLAVSAAETAKNSVSDGHAQATMVAQANAEGEGGEGGEGGGGGGAPQLATNDAAYLTQLGLIRGHLNVGFDLYQQGEVDAAKTHMKHPGDELYAALEPAFAARGVPGFAKQLETLAAMVQREAALSEVEAAYSDLEAAIEAAEAGASAASLHSRLKAVVQLVRTAAEEYEAGVNNGAVVNAHEYQDALGFVRIASKIVESINAGSDENVGNALREIKTQLQSIEPAWPSVVPPKNVSTDPSLIYGAAARIEIAALPMK